MIPTSPTKPDKARALADELEQWPKGNAYYFTPDELALVIEALRALKQPESGEDAREVTSAMIAVGLEVWARLKLDGRPPARIVTEIYSAMRAVQGEVAEVALLPGLREALLWKPNTPQLENAMTYAWEQAIKAFIRSLESAAPKHTRGGADEQSS